MLSTLKKAVADAFNMSDIMRSWPFAIKTTCWDIANVILDAPVKV